MSRLTSKTPPEEKQPGPYNALAGRKLEGAFSCTHDDCPGVSTAAYHDAKENKLRFKCGHGHDSELYWKI